MMRLPARAFASLLAVALHCAAAAPSDPLSFTVFYDPSSREWTYTANLLDPQGICLGQYTAETPSGFPTLKIQANSLLNETFEHFCMGYAEGAALQPLIWANAQNLLAMVLADLPGWTDIPPAWVAFIEQQDAWARAQVALNTTSPLWQATGLVLRQLDGLMAGYASVAPPGQQLSPLLFSLISSNMDWVDGLNCGIPVNVSGGGSSCPDPSTMTGEELAQHTTKRGRCSSAVVVTPTLSDMFFGHTTWAPYLTMTRMFKHYSFAAKNARFKPGSSLSLSSYPGCLTSIDDFFVAWSSGLAVSETTISNLNSSLWVDITPQTLWSWQRVRSAMLLASDGAAWAAVVGYDNSGTYSNQYLVVNMGQFVPRGALKPGTLTIVELLPGVVASADLTGELSRAGFFASFNVNLLTYDQANITSTLRAHGFDEFAAGAGDEPLAGLSFQMAPRAQLFRRDAHTAVSLDSFFALLRSNGMALDDPITMGDPFRAICARGDLKGQGPFGCTDAKAVSASGMANRTTLIISGPTLGTSSSLPPFTWAQFPGGPPHAGQPDVFNFTAQNVSLW